MQGFVMPGLTEPAPDLIRGIPAWIAGQARNDKSVRDCGSGRNDKSVRISK
jgi:hypothetical protein